MFQFLLMLLAGAVLTILAGSGALILTYLAYAGGHLLAELADNVADRVGGAFASLSEAAAERFRRRQLLEEIMAGFRQGRRANVDRQALQAAAATKAISAAIKATGAAMATCCEVQRFTAKAGGATDMAEVEFDPICLELRQRVIDTLDVSLEMLESYPGFAGSPRLLKQAVALRALRPLCADCELLKFSVAGVPTLCTPAASLVRPSERKDEETT